MIDKNLCCRSHRDTLPQRTVLLLVLFPVTCSWTEGKVFAQAVTWWPVQSTLDCWHHKNVSTHYSQTWRRFFFLQVKLSFSRADPKQKPFSVLKRDFTFTFHVQCAEMWVKMKESNVWILWPGVSHEATAGEWGEGFCVILNAASLSVSLKARLTFLLSHFIPDSNVFLCLVSRAASFVHLLFWWCDKLLLTIFFLSTGCLLISLLWFLSTLFLPCSSALPPPSFSILSLPVTAPHTSVYLSCYLLPLSFTGGLLIVSLSHHLPP